MEIRNVANRIPKVDLEMITAKVTFFLTDGYFGATMPFMNVFYVSLGLSATQAGMISGVSLAVSSFFNPLWSTLADATGQRKLIFIIMCLGTASTVFSMPWIALAVGKTEKNMTCAHDNHTAAIASSNDCHPKLHLLNSNVIFYSLLALNVVSWIFYTSVRCYVDGIVMNVVKTGVKERSYGSQRVFSSLGYASINFLTGIIADHYHPKGMSHYTAIFYVFLPCIIFLIPWGHKLIGQAKWEEGSNPTADVGVGVTSQLLSAFKDLDFTIFFLSVIVSGLTLNTFNCFFFLLMEHEMHSSKTLMTFAIVVSVVCEITVFAFSTKLIRFCGGTISSFTIGIFSFFPRFMVMSYVYNPWVVLAVQPLHGLGMGLAWAAAVEHTYEAFPVDIRVTAIALMSSIEFIASSAVANMVGGVLYDLYGGRILFRGSGIIAAIWCLFMTLYFGIRHQLSKRQAIKKLNQPSYPQGISHHVELEVQVEETF